MLRIRQYEAANVAFLLKLKRQRGANAAGFAARIYYWQRVEGWMIACGVSTSREDCTFRVFMDRDGVFDTIY